jgi:hypothetical protein
MSLETRAALIDDQSQASNPGGVAVQPLRYVAHFPLWPVGFAGALLAGVALAASRPKFWWVPVLALVLNGLHWLRVRLRFRLGCVNPAQVVALHPFTLAVFTDLSTGVGEVYPVIKILRHPVPRGSSYKVGDPCATVATYTGAPQASHWADFSPIMADCATADRVALQNVLQSIPPEEWSQLAAGLKQMPMPLKQGLYPLACLPGAS